MNSLRGDFQDLAENPVLTGEALENRSFQSAVYATTQSNQDGSVLTNEVFNT